MELMLTKPMVRMSVLSVVTGTFLRKTLDFSRKYMIVVLLKINNHYYSKVFLENCS